MVNYLKKSKIRKLLLSLGYQVPVLKYCGYKFYRGSEWFTFDDFHVYICRSFMSIEKIYFDEFDRQRTLSRKVIYGSEFCNLVNSLS